MKTKTITEVVTKALARSGPDLHPDQIRLDDSVQTDKTKVLTQSDINSGLSGGGGGGGPAPDLSGYAKTDYVDSADNALGALIAANTQAIEDIEIPEGGESYNDEAIKKEISDLQDAFDTAVAAAQEGAENLTIELQTYAKKEDIPTDNKDLANGAKYITLAEVPAAPEPPNLDGYALKTEIPTDNKDLANGAGYITAEDVQAGGIDWANLPVLAV